MHSVHEILGFAFEHWADKNHTPVCGRHFNGARVGNRPADLCAHPVEQNLVGWVLRFDGAPGFRRKAARAIPEVADSLAGYLAQHTVTVNDLVAGE
jgi:hypothetical protein